MIFVTIGTSEPFDRLLRAVDALPGSEELVVQVGASSVRPGRATCVSFLAFEDLVSRVRRARTVVTHAGAGSVMTCLANGKRPIVVPRLRRYGETADDHQLAFGRRLHEAGLVTLVEDVERLAVALSGASPALPARSAAKDGLTRDLREYLRATIGQAGVKQEHGGP